MASLNPSFYPDPEDLTWVDQNIQILDNFIETNIGTLSVSLFQVPETITTKKPEAYQPQQLGLGPIHHLIRQPYMKMEQKKFAVVKNVLLWYNVENYKEVVFDNIEKLVPVLRSCYDMFLQGDDDSLAWIFGVDGLFLLDLFRTYNSSMENEKEAYFWFLKEKARECETKNIEENTLLCHKEIVVTLENQMEWERILHLPHHQLLPKVGPKKRLLAQDMMMVENQIPFKVLKEINQALHSSSGNSSNSDITTATSMFQTFCKIHSPLKLCSSSQALIDVDHLLHYMYYSIINNVPLKKTEDQHIDDGYKIFVGVQVLSQASNFFTNIPRNEFVQVYEQTVSILETFSKTKILIPSASKLHHDRAGFRFYSLAEDEGVQNIRIHEKDIYLPQLTLNIDSEVILRNLVAYETLTTDNSNGYPLTEYMGLMCALILSVDDVTSLGDVIKGDLGGDEVVKLFKSMTDSITTMKTKDKSKLQDLIKQVNEVYNSGLWMKTHILLKKLATWLLVVLKSIAGFVEASWKIVAFVVSIVTLFILTSQAYCDVYGCDKKSVTLLSYASS